MLTYEERQALRKAADCKAIIEAIDAGIDLYGLQ